MKVRYFNIEWSNKNLGLPTEVTYDVAYLMEGYTEEELKAMPKEEICEWIGDTSSDTLFYFAADNYDMNLLTDDDDEPYAECWNSEMIWDDEDTNPNNENVITEEDAEKAKQELIDYIKQFI